MADATSAAASAAADTAPLSMSDAAGLMGPADEETNQDAATPAEEAGEGAVQEGSADEADAAAAEGQQPGETDGDETADGNRPAIDAPRSWTKEEKAAFAALPREHQQRIAERERAREVEIRRGQDEVANRMRGIQAQQQAAEQARQQYEAALHSTNSYLQQQLAGEFQDIRSMDDVDRMREADPIRYLRYDSAIKRAQAVAQEVQQSQYRQQQEQTARFEAFKQQETKRFLEMAPEFADPKTAPKMQAEVQALFADVGVTTDELRALWNGGRTVSLHDHRVQAIIRDAVRYRVAKQAVKTAPAKPGSPVQKPGIATNRGEAVSARAKQISDSLTRSGSRKDALALLNMSGKRT